MFVTFLTALPVPAPESIRKLIVSRPDQHTELLVAAVPTVKALFGLIEKLEAMGYPVRQRDRDLGSGLPLIAVWLASPHENPEPLAAVADLLLLGGGWALLEEVVADLGASRESPRGVRLGRLARLPGVYVPSLYALEYATDGTLVSVIPESGVPWPRGLPRGAPFDREELPPLRHPAPAIQRVLADVPDLASLAAEAPEGERVFLRFALGLPGESAEAFAQWVKGLRHRIVVRLRDERRLPPVSVSLICYVPKPRTPLQWRPMPDERALKERLTEAARALKPVPGVSVTHDLPKWALLEGMLAMGDRRVGDLLLAVHRLGWDRARVEHPMNPGFFLHRPRRREEILPWDHVDWGQDRDLLRARYEAAMSEVGAEP
ncbi:MAG: hypothetical protein ACE5JD_03705 [Candidatus Methylomirabilia bacterium]